MTSQMTQILDLHSLQQQQGSNLVHLLEQLTSSHMLHSQLLNTHQLHWGRKPRQDWLPPAKKHPAPDGLSFSPPANWSPPGRKRPLTRGRTKRREEERDRVTEQGSRARLRREEQFVASL